MKKAMQEEEFEREVWKRFDISMAGIGCNTEPTWYDLILIKKYYNEFRNHPLCKEPIEKAERKYYSIATIDCAFYRDKMKRLGRKICRETWNVKVVKSKQQAEQIPKGERRRTYVFG